MKETEYAYAVAYIKTLENKMLTHQDMESLLNAQDIETAFKILNDRGYGSTDTNEYDIDTVLKSELQKAWGIAKECCPKEAPIDVLLYKNDFHNLKTILKSVVSDVEWRSMIIEPCTVDPDLIYDSIKNVDFSNLPEFIRDPAIEAYKIVTSTVDGQRTEIFLDKAAWEKMHERALKEKNQILNEWIDINILIANMKIAVRAAGKSKEFISDSLIKDSGGIWEKLLEAAVSGKNAVIDKISEIGYKDASECLLKSFSLFEKWCDNQKMSCIKKARMKSFGFEPILGFLIGKEFEQQAVRIIMSGKLNNVDNEIIKERLRDLYV